MRYSLLIISIFFLLSCGKEATETTKCNTFPTAPENYWVYNTTHYETNGSIKVADTDTIRIEQTKTFNGNSYYYFNPFWIRNVDCNTIAAYDPVTNTELKIRNNGTVNDSLAYNIPYSTSPCKYGIKLYINKDRTVINGISSYKISDEITDCSGKALITRNMYLSEGIGVVKIEVYQFTAAGVKFMQTKQELASYKVKP